MLLGIAGMVGSGKTTLARALASRPRVESQLGGAIGFVVGGFAAYLVWSFASATVVELVPEDFLAVVDADGAVSPIGPPGTLVGLFDDIEVSSCTVALDPGSLLVALTALNVVSDSVFLGLNRLRAYLPLLLALSASSPLWRGRPTGWRVPTGTSSASNSAPLF